MHLKSYFRDVVVELMNELMSIVFFPEVLEEQKKWKNNRNVNAIHLSDWETTILANAWCEVELKVNNEEN